MVCLSLASMTARCGYLETTSFLGHCSRLILIYVLFVHGAAFTSEMQFEATDSACGSLLLKSKSIMISIPPLLLTYDQRILWKDNIVTLGSGRRQRPLLWRLLIALVDRPNQATSPDELIADLWPIDPGESPPDTNLQGVLIKMLEVLDRSFRRVDPEFKSLRLWRGGDAAWDTGDRTNGKKLHSAEVFEGLREIYWKGQLVDLTTREFGVALALLKQKNGGPVSLEKLFTQVRARRMLDPVSSANMLSSVQKVISQTRMKFRKVDAEFDRIKVVNGHAYRWADQERNGYP